MGTFELVAINSDQRKYPCEGRIKFKYNGKEYETGGEFLFYYHQRAICCLDKWEPDNILWNKIPLKLTAGETLLFLAMLNKAVLPVLDKCNACEDLPLIPPLGD